MSRWTAPGVPRWLLGRLDGALRRHGPSLPDGAASEVRVGPHVLLLAPTPYGGWLGVLSAHGALPPLVVHAVALRAGYAAPPPRGLRAA